MRGTQATRWPFAAPFTDEADFVAFEGTHLKGRREIGSFHREIFDTVVKASVIVFSARAARIPSAGLGSPLSTRAKKIVEAPPDGAAAGDKKEREAVKDRALAGVQYRPKTLGKMILKISDGHLAADDECRIAGEQPNRDQDAAEKFDHPGEPVLRRKLRRRSGPVQTTEDAEQFSRPIAGKRQSHEDPHEGIEVFPVPPEKSLHDHPPP